MTGATDPRANTAITSKDLFKGSSEFDGELEAVEERAVSRVETVPKRAPEA